MDQGVKDTPHRTFSFANFPVIALGIPGGDHHRRTVQGAQGGAQTIGILQSADENNPAVARIARLLPAVFQYTGSDPPGQVGHVVKVMDIQIIIPLLETSLILIAMGQQPAAAGAGLFHLGKQIRIRILARRHILLLHLPKLFINGQPLHI